MGKTREIKGRMKAVGNIQRITKTMQMIATARFNAAQRRATASQPYTRKIAELVGELAKAAGEGSKLSHPLLAPPSPAVGRHLVLVLTSNRGLCGGYNANILRTATAEIESIGEGDVRLETVGKKAISYFKFSGKAIDQAHTEFGDQPRYEQVDQLAQRFIDEFTAGQYDSVKVVAMGFQSMSRQYPEVTTLLPLKPPTAADQGEQAELSEEAAVDYDFYPEPEKLLAELLPITVKTRLFQLFNEAVVSEQVARMIAMKAATDAAGKMRKNLHREYNRARQAAITTELTEIIGGAAALE